MHVFSLSLRSLSLFLLLFLAFQSCKTNDSSSAISPKGYWQQLGYGKIIEWKDSTVSVYDHCKVSCNLSFEEKTADLGQIIAVKEDTLTIQKGINQYTFLKLKELPLLCSQADSLQQQNPIYNFETLWHTFHEQYAYFEEREIDWQKAYNIYKAQLSNTSTELELYQVLEEMLASLNDGHVELQVPPQLKADLKKNKEPLKKEARVNLFDLGQKVQNSIPERYLDSVYAYNSGIVKWGTIQENIVYVQVNAMFLLANYQLPENLSFREFFAHYMKVAQKRENQRQDEVAGAKFIMDSIISSFPAARAYILDMRFNIGGKDQAALEIMSHFTPEATTVGTKKARLGEGFTQEQAIFLKPSETRFTGDVYLLTSHETASAAEILVLSSLELPHVIRIGSKTEGVFSDMLDKKLPNGWEYTLSNEVYADMEGKSYEHTGIPADFPIAYARDKQEFLEQLLLSLKEGDEAIETALSLYEKTNQPSSDN